jgi:hypothetical protein
MGVSAITAWTASTQPSTTIAWSLMRGSCCRPPSPIISACASSWMRTSTSGGGRSGGRRGQAPQPRHVGPRRGDCIDDADALRAGGTGRVLGHVVKAASTLGTFLRSFRWGHVRQLDRVSRELLARAFSAGAGPGAAPFTIDLDSTICETYGLAKEGALHHGYTGVRGYHPLLAVAGGNRRRAHGASARGSCQHRPGRRPFP